MTDYRHWHDEVWVERYGHICPATPGKVVHIEGIGDHDAYNPALYEDDDDKILAIRVESRQSNALQPSVYHPGIYFARRRTTNTWKVDPTLEPFEMLEDPLIFYIEEGGKQKVVLGGVRLRNHHGEIIPQTEYYKGDSLEDLERVSFAVVHGMKDVRILQLPDKRFLVCKRPRGDAYKRGRITLHVIDTLDQLTDIDTLRIPVLATLDSCQDALDWVGVNNAYMLMDDESRPWVGLLGHVALEDKKHNIHYAACTYKISLKDLFSKHVHKICPHIIASRTCFEDGPHKTALIKDIVFPGHLEHLQDYTYRLWTGLSDTRVGTLEVDDPFQMRDQAAPQA